MSGKKLSSEETRVLIQEIERYAGYGPPYRGEFDFFKDWSTVSELVEGTLRGLGYDCEWVAGEFSNQLEAAVKAHVQRAGYFS